MNTQLRVLSVLLGALLVAATYTYPLWQPLLERQLTVQQAFAGLPAALVPQFQLLPPEERNAFLALAEEDEVLARGLAISRFRPDVVVPQAQQTLPESAARSLIISGDFPRTSPFIGADGTMQMYQLADGRRLLHFEEFRSVQAPEAHVYLSANAAPTNREELEQAGLHIDLGALQGNVGSQNYEIAPDIDLLRYNSIVIFSESLDLVVSYAPFAIRL